MYRAGSEQVKELLVRANRLRQDGDIHEAIDVALEAKSMVSEGTDATVVFECFRALIILFQESGRGREACSAARALQAMTARGDMTQFQAVAGVHLSRCLVDIGQWREARGSWPESLGAKENLVDLYTLTTWASVAVELAIGLDRVVGVLERRARATSKESECHALRLLKGQALRASGRFEEAELEINGLVKQFHQFDWRLQHDCLRELAIVAALRGEFGAALRCYNAALELILDDPAYSSLRADIVIQSAILLSGPLNNPAEARLRLLELREQSLAPIAPALAQVANWILEGAPHDAPDQDMLSASPNGRLLGLISMGEAYRQSGRITEARGLLESAEQESRCSSNIALRCEALQLLGECQFECGCEQQAEESLQAALDASKTSGLLDRQAAVLAHLARVKVANRRWADAIDCIRESTRIFAGIRGGLNSNYYRTSFGQGYRPVLEQLAVLTADQAPLVAWELAETLLNSRGLAHERAGHEQPAWMEARNHLVELERRRRDVPEDSEEERKLRDEIRRILIQADDERGHIAGVALQPGEMQGLFRSHRGRIFCTFLETPHFIAVLWATWDGRVGAVSTGGQRAPVRRSANDWIRLVSSGEQGTDVSEPRPKGTAHPIWEALLQPMLDEVGMETIDRLVLLPGPHWHGFPFHTIPTTDGQPLSELVPVTYAPSVTAYAHCHRTLSQRSRHRNRLAGVFAVASQDTPEKAHGRLATLHDVAKSFPGELSEAETVQQAADTWSGGSICVFLGHCLPGANPAVSTLLLRSGEILAVDLAQIELPRAKIFVLAACAGLHDSPGDIDEGTGPAAALVEAGVPAVIASGWPVREDVACRFLVQFADALQVQKIGDAYRTAQRDVRQEFPDPHHWGAFFLIGSERDPGPWPALRRGCNRIRRWMKGRSHGTR